jgi:hypothetical protein
VRQGTYGDFVKRGEVAHLYCGHCVPDYTIGGVLFDEPPWDRYLAMPRHGFLCRWCRKRLTMHVHHGPGTPNTERFLEVSST